MRETVSPRRRARYSSSRYSRQEIEEHLYGSASLPLSNVVDSAICSIRAKLKQTGGGSVIHTRPRLGYVLDEAVP